VNIEDLKGFDEQLAEKLKQDPTEMLGLLEEAAKEAADEVTYPRDADAEEVEDIHVSLKWDQWEPTSIRDLKSQQVKCPRVGRR
jgi:DNA replicative helicase MCM subunit Mcm2 (Cdc46/Mcm family)